MYLNFDHYYKRFNLTKNQEDFLEWCRTKFNIEELGICSITNYKEFVKQLHLKEFTNTKSKNNQLESLQVFCNLEIDKRKYNIKELFYPEQQEFTESGSSIYGGYKVIYDMAHQNWFNSRNSNDIYPSTEEIALEMGLLRLSYKELERQYEFLKMSREIERGEFSGNVSHKNLDLIHNIDWEKRMEALIITQLKNMMYSNRNNKDYNISETFIYKTITDKIIDGIETKVIHKQGEVSEKDRTEIYAEIKNINKMHQGVVETEKQRAKDEDDKPSIHLIKHNPVLNIYYGNLRKKGIYPSWKILATPDPSFERFSNGYKDFLNDILINNKQNKSYGALTKATAKRGIFIEEASNTAFDLREDFYLVETLLDGASLYKEIKNNDGTIDYVRLVSGRKIDKIREESKRDSSSIITKF